MKLTKDELAARLERNELFLRHYGRLFTVTALATTMDEANAHMAAHKGESLLLEHGGFCFIVPHDSVGTEGRPLPDLLRELVRAIEDATPGELQEAAHGLDEMGVGHAGKPRARRIARMLAPVVHKLRT